jgi:hypothetical protein
MVRCGVLLLLLIGLFVSVPPARADTQAGEPPELASLETMVGNLGYTTTEDPKKQWFSITWSGAGNYNYKMHFSLSNSKTVYYAYVQLTDLTAAQLEKLQYAKLLEANDAGDFYFSMEKNDAGETLYGNAIIPVGGLTPQGLRTILSNWSDSMDATDAIWNTALWK